MRSKTDPVESAVAESVLDPFAELSNRPAAIDHHQPAAANVAVTARLHGFDLDDRPLLTGLPALPQEIVIARSTTPLSRAQIGATVVVLYEQGDAQRPIVVGVIRERSIMADAPSATAALPQLVSVQVDEDRLVLTAERQIVLKCGDASITLTRAGKVLIRGKYVVSRATGYNKIKGAAVDIN